MEFFSSLHFDFLLIITIFYTPLSFHSSCINFKIEFSHKMVSIVFEQRTNETRYPEYMQRWIGRENSWNIQGSIRLHAVTLSARISLLKSAVTVDIPSPAIKLQNLHFDIRHDKNVTFSSFLNHESLSC